MMKSKRQKRGWGWSLALILLGVAVCMPRLRFGMTVESLSRRGAGSGNFLWTAFLHPARHKHDTPWLAPHRARRRKQDFVVLARLLAAPRPFFPLKASEALHSSPHPLLSRPPDPLVHPPA